MGPRPTQAVRHRQARQDLVKPLVLELETLLRERRASLSPGSTTAKAISYSLTRWAAFTRFPRRRFICLTKNAVERALRGIAVGRRNWIFCASDAGGNRAAAIYTLIETAKLNDIDPQGWLADVLARLPDQAHRRIVALGLERQPRSRNRRSGRLTSHTTCDVSRPRTAVLVGCLRGP